MIGGITYTVRNIFVINPHSGKKRRQRKLIADIEAAASKLGLQCEVYYTKAAKDGERYINEICEQMPRAANSCAFMRAAATER